MADAQGNDAGNENVYTVKSGDSLSRIAKTFATDSQANVETLYDLNKDVIGSDSDMIRPGQKLRIPSSWQNISQRERTPSAVAGKKPILVGSIIHLQNGLEKGDYLETRGWVTDKPVITLWQDEQIKAFVFTHTDKNRSKGSGSWQILSATGKETGEPLLFGDKIHLLNLYSGAGYLDSFEWVDRLEPFKDFYPAMTIGVFTSSLPKRGGGPSGTWTVRSADEKKASGAKVVEGDAIYLENDYPGAGFLHTWGEVTKHKTKDSDGKDIQMFQDYTGQRKFVFTAASPNSSVQDSSPQGSHEWTITLTNLAEHLYRVFHQQGDESAPWHDGGIFKIGDRLGQPVVALDFKFPADKATGSGQVTYQGQSPVGFTATRYGDNQNHYAIKFTQSADPFPDGDWQIGAHESQSVVALRIKVAENSELGVGDQKLVGSITYDGGPELRFRGVRSNAKNSRLLYDYYHPHLLKGRTIKIEGVIDATYRVLRESFSTMITESMTDTASTPVKTPLDRTLAEIRSTKRVTDDDNKKLDEIIDKLTTGRDSQDEQTFQIKQILNLYEFSRILNGFFWDELQDDMKQSLENHQRDQTLAPLHLLRRCSQNIAADHMIIQQAAMQRRWEQGEQNTKPTMGAQARELLHMDKLAIKAISPFQHLLPGHPAQPAIITYLSDRTHIHSLPYTDRFILVGVSYDRVPPAAGTLGEEASPGNEFYAYELLAIPHEVGHYVYQHGALPDGRTFVDLSKQFEDNNPYYRWCEEIFADLYGCIVAGPLSVLGLQALLTSIDRERAWKDDEVHPTPALRLFILTEILRILPVISAKMQKDAHNRKWNGPDNFDEVKKELDKRWATTIEQWGYKRVDPGEGRPTRLYLPDESATYLDRLVNVERVIKAVEPIIIEFATHLLDAAQPVHIDSGQSTENILSIQIPWSSPEPTTLQQYSAKMQALVDESARKRVPHQTFVDVQSYKIQRNSVDPDEILQQYLDSWEDQGPHGFGDH